jgi:dipeptidyl aminopeptidase/acylaminoacyl peptidase
MIKTAYSNGLRVVAMIMLAVTLVVLAGAILTQAHFPDEAVPDGHSAIAFEKAGDIWVASKMHPVNLTPNTATFNDVDPVVSPDGKKVAFTSDRDGDFEIYTANVSTGKLQRLTDNVGDDRYPAWSPDGTKITFWYRTANTPESYMTKIDVSREPTSSN